MWLQAAVARPQPLGYLPETMPDATPLPLKKDVALALLDGPSMLVHLDPRRPGVVVPKWFKNQPSLVLQLGLNLAVPIVDLEVTDDGISCTLSFNRAPFWCDLPWAAVYALVGEDRRGMIWPDDVPSEISQQSPRASLKVVGGKKPRKKADGADVEDARTAEVASAAPAVGHADEGAEAGQQSSGGREEAQDPKAEDAKAEDAKAEDAKAAGGRKLPPYLRVVK